MRSLAVLALVMVASYFVGCNALDEQTIQAPSKPMAEYKAQDVVKETLPIIQAFVDAQYNYALGKDSVPQWDQYLVNPDPNLKQRIDRAVYLRKGGAEMLSYSGHFKAVEHSKIFFEKDRWILDDVVLWYELPQGKPSNPIREQGGMNYQFSVQKNAQGEWKILSWRDDVDVLPGSAWDYKKTDIKVPKVERSSSVSARYSSWYNRYAAVNYALRHWNDPNPNWCEYSRNGGDCTNFVSQCLLTGGWRQKKNGGSYCSNQVWFHNGKGHCWNSSTKNYSCSWTQAKDIQNYLSAQSNVTKVDWNRPISYDVQVGDIVQLVNKRGVAYHTMIITRIDNGQYLVTYRSAGTNGNPGFEKSCDLRAENCIVWLIGRNNYWWGFEAQKKREVFLSLFP